MDHALRGEAVSNQQEVGAAELPFEFMLNALRLREGFPLRLITERTGQAWVGLDNTLRAAEQRGLLTCTGTPGSEVLRPTLRGFDFLSDLQAMFLVERGG